MIAFGFKAKSPTHRSGEVQLDERNFNELSRISQVPSESKLYDESSPFSRKSGLKKGLPDRDYTFKSFVTP